MRIHDPGLLDKLSALKPEGFKGHVFRATRQNFDPLAFSTYGGRWAPVGTVNYQVPVLYTSCEESGALAELSYHWGAQNPPPSKPAVVHKIAIATAATVRLSMEELSALGVDEANYGGPVVSLTQQIGAACAFLGYDGLLVPSARWNCENLIIFSLNHNITQHLSLLDHKLVDWLKWAQEKNLL